MCRKLGKGHIDYIERKENQYENENGVKRMRRTYAGRRICDHYGHNVLIAYTDLRDKLWSWFPQQPGDGIFKSSAKKAKRLARMERHTFHGLTRHGRARREHLRRNHVSVVSS